MCGAGEVVLVEGLGRHDPFPRTNRVPDQLFLRRSCGSPWASRTSWAAYLDSSGHAAMISDARFCVWVEITFGSVGGVGSDGFGGSGWDGVG